MQIKQVQLVEILCCLLRLDKKLKYILTENNKRLNKKASNKNNNWRNKKGKNIKIKLKYRNAQYIKQDKLKNAFLNKDQNYRKSQFNARNRTIN
jgi:hypothetical protein